MAAKVPVVATNVGGNSELIQNGESGWLVPPQDANQLAAKIEQVLAMEHSEIELVRQRAYDRVQQLFSIEAVARQHEILYAQLLASR
jgi:glycosyltransferase involved in cell wall biosynthesis